MGIEFSDDETLPLNKMIKDAWKISKENSSEVPNPDFIQKLREIFDAGFNDGQAFVWKFRQRPVDIDREATVVTTKTNIDEAGNYIQVSVEQDSSL